ncbi:insulinase family protein [Leptospira sp. 2 VSF19]|uniref:Insulinase family protein n=1 Tax=Leptospira soteropolitanensis TaxID=2950025 RepID=A0AAW5VL75_9LEPT|nr:pitrilysin family protein [Leptospira soteropolitanensis]MCW7492909.1 insulinase family protein [Leptospira soteropolitanensis]MCW7500144.1 insulinase family protein [Leptospira soteropolitanensis]MCW7522395.1 insulinase family protein [Leptospira soteropolitanensis]MCW7526251.1 insulinase family protein [Leptospira soteropolitanensis]MCW7529637.1 insulinase family protein [Leptospira soteropolitanensis]
MKSKIIFLIGISFFSLSAREMGDFVRDLKFKPLEFEVPKISSVKQPSGVEVFSLKNSEFPIVYADLYVYHGKKHLGKRPVEITRLLEDSWELSGSKTYPKEKFLETLEFYGATFSVTIDYEKTMFSFAYLKSTEKEVLPVIQSFFNAPNLDESLMKTTKGKLSEEIKRRNDNPTALGSRKAKESLFRGTLLGTSMQLTSLESLSLENLVQFQKEILSAEKRRFLVTGDYDLKAFDNFFPKFNEKTDERESELITPSLLSENVKKEGKEIRLITKDVNQTFISMIGVLPEHNHPDFYAIQVLNYIIGAGGFNSYYMREIRNNRGLAYSAGSNTEFQENYGTIQFFAMTKTESAKEVLSLMRELIQPKLIDSLTEEELVRAKNAIINQFVFQFEDDKRTLMSEVRRRDHKMPDGYLQNFRSEIDRLTLSDLKRVGKLYFQSDKLIVTVVGPKTLESSWKGSVKVLNPED